MKGGKMKKKQFLQLKKNESYYYIGNKIDILNIYNDVHLVKIRIIDTGNEIIIDASAISLEQVCEKTISIDILGGELR